MSVDSVPVIKARDITMSFDEHQVLRGVDLTVQRGEIVALLGPNGAGKTTFLEILEGFRRPTSGQVTVLGATPLTAGEDWRSRVGVVLQSWRDHSLWRVGELISHAGEFYRPYGSPDRPRPWPIDDLLARVGLRDKVSQKISSLSGGERRRLDLAIGLIGRPDLLFLAEPTNGLDPQARSELHDLIVELADDEVTVLMATHDLGEAEKIADRLLILTGGRFVADESPDQLRR
ncbi:ABC transporter ATP-binding protein [Austwickia sp. TVS 96-490-7B]|uniref:ABC transporter ATP-binding protein n=1 Tax=Austwickia sp. TVS 96-490-7B TaxID=2830843 RepID=UPI00210828E4|nr:ABC transporter ATP-binding protein [Austwickia sp. TVS 96-490-7B]